MMRLARWACLVTFPRCFPDTDMTSRTALVLAAVLLAGCATKNTPQQERTWAAYEACKAEGRVTHVYIYRVEPNGLARWRASDTAYGFQEAQACMKEQLAKPRRP